MTDQKQLENEEYFNYLGSTINYERRTCLIKSRIAMAKAVYKRKTTIFTSKLDLNLRKKLAKCCTWSIGL
jgi:DNA-directed RNA polymerase